MPKIFQELDVHPWGKGLESTMVNIKDLEEVIVIKYYRAAIEQVNKSCHWSLWGRTGEIIVEYTSMFDVALQGPYSLSSSHLFSLWVCV